MVSSALSDLRAQVLSLQQRSAALLVYQSVLDHEVAHHFCGLLSAIEQVTRQAQHSAAESLNTSAVELDCLKAYGSWFRAIAEYASDATTFWINQILLDDNPFTRQAAQHRWADISPALVHAAQLDLQQIQALAVCASQLGDWVQQVAGYQLSSFSPVFSHGPDAESCVTANCHDTSDALTAIRSQLLSAKDWAEPIQAIAHYHHQQGTGMFATYRAFRWQNKKLTGIAAPDLTRLEALVGYEAQKQALLKNTEALLSGYPALHVLLYGSRGSGKSSLVKALLAQYAEQGLRLIEVAKSDLRDLTTIVEQLRPVPQKFIIFVDDLSFEEDDDTYKALKVVLEGTLTARPANVVVYATSNRRHLIREFFSDRPRPSDADEIHAWDTNQEKLSFSDRFGLTLTFEPADQTTYLAIVRHLATRNQISLPPADLEAKALQWATRHNGRSGRSAQQFIQFLCADLKKTIVQ